jgi:hypothetical protein
MASRTIQARDIAWETPQFQQATQWLEDNGLDPARIPLDSEIVVTDEAITCESIVPNGKGGYVVVQGEDRLLRETITVPTHSTPETFGI